MDIQKNNSNDLAPEHERDNIRVFLRQLAEGETGRHTLKTSRLTKDKRNIEVSMVASVLGNHDGETLLIIASE